MFELIIIGLICYSLGSGKPLLSASFSENERISAPADHGYNLSDPKVKAEYDYWYKKGQEQAEKDKLEGKYMRNRDELIKWLRENV